MDDHTEWVIEFESNYNAMVGESYAYGATRKDAENYFFEDDRHHGCTILSVTEEET